MSKKLIELWEFSSVNLIVVCWEFKCDTKFSSSVGPCCQIMNMSSIYLFHSLGCSDEKSR